MTKRKTHPFKSESEMCAAFTAWARDHGWEVHAETSGFDLLLVRREPHGSYNVNSGDIVGVQAKLRPNVLVLDQALPEWTKATGPDMHCVLVPHPSHAFLRVASRLRICVIGYVGKPNKPWELWLHHRHDYGRKPWRPDFTAELPAGVPAPRAMTKWKIAAVRLCLLAEHRGYLTALDFAKAGINMGRWTDHRYRWLISTREKDSTGKMKYVLGDDPKLPHKRNPEVVEAVRARFGADGGLDGNA